MLMAGYELSKQVIYPDVTIWQSHLITILFSTILAATASYVGLQRFQKMRQSHVELETHVAERAASLEEAKARLEADVMERRRIEGILRSIVSDTASVTGSEFFRQLVRSLAAGLDVPYAFVSECVASPRSRVRTLAFWCGGDFTENLEYDTADTPCDAVVAGQASFWPRDVQKHFPKDKDLTTLQAESYLAVPIMSANAEVIGHAVIMDTAPMTDDPFARPIMELVALRARSELQRLRAEEALRQSETQRIEALLQSDALKSALLASVSHEFRTPLASIKSSLATFFQRQSRIEPGVRRELLDGIDKEVDYLTRLVENLLEMSRIEAGAMAPSRDWQPIEDLVEGSLRRVGPQLKSRKVELDIPGDLQPVLVDGPQIQHVLVNLLDNAIKYSHENAPIQVAVRAHHDQMEVRVVSLGAVIPSDDLTRVFERFYRVETSLVRKVRGTGLGLAICRGLVEGHGGKIWAESTPDKATAITFTLPLHQPPSMALT
jgi:signal transduction histidine kinase